MARIISIVNQKGGTGKSACTANLAVGLAQKNMKVLIVDADPQSDVSAGFGYRDCDESNETLTALMDTVMKDEDIPSDCYIRHQAEGIDIICSNIGLAGTEVQLVNAMSREYVLKQILYGIKDQYDAVIIDCMPSLGMITINALAASDEVLIPVEASYLPIKGLEKMPVIIKDLTDDESTVIMVDSNIQREELLISEKAFAYKMKYEALKRQGKRSDLTSCQVGKKLAAEEVSQNTEDSSRQILRYIHLTLLLPELLEMADDKKLPFNTAVEISYLRNEEQQVLLQYMSNHNMVPSMKQAKELKQISKERMLTYSEIDQICMNESTEKVQVQIPAKKLKQYFPETYTKTQMEEIIFKLLASWAEREGKE